MAYGIIKVDNITFDQGGSDQNVTASGIYRAITSGVTVTGTISGATIVGTATVSGATVTGTTVQGTTVQGTTVQGVSGTFTSLTGTTITGTTINGTTVSSTTGTFTNITGTTITGTTINGTTVNSITGNFTSLTGITVTGTTANFTSGIFTTQVSGLTVTGTQSSFTSGNFVTLSGATATFTSGVIASGTAAAPSLSILADPNTGIYSPAADTLAFAEGGVEVMRIDNSPRLLIGTSSARDVGGGFQSSSGSQLFIEGGATDLTLNTFVLNRNDTNPAGIVIGKSRGTAAGGNTILQSNDYIARISFAGADGTDVQTPAAFIEVSVDGTPGSNDMPGRLVFSTTSDGASVPTERFRITNDGVKAYNQPVPVAINATTTLTVANLKTGIITSTSAAATDMTLPTGANTQAGFIGIYDNFAFEWSIINTGPSLVRVLAAAGHTVIGSGSVATGTSGRFVSRQNSSGTFVTYRLSS